MSSCLSLVMIVRIGMKIMSVRRITRWFVFLLPIFTFSIFMAVYSYIYGYITNFIGLFPSLFSEFCFRTKTDLIYDTNIILIMEKIIIPLDLRAFFLGMPPNLISMQSMRRNLSHTLLE